MPVSCSDKGKQNDPSHSQYSLLLLLKCTDSYLNTTSLDSSTIFLKVLDHSPVIQLINSNMRLDNVKKNSINANPFASTDAATCTYFLLKSPII